MMATRSAVFAAPRFIGGARRTQSLFPRSFSGDGRILSEEERAAENVYIQKMERERMEKMKRRLEMEKAERESKIREGSGRGKQNLKVDRTRHL